MAENHVIKYDSALKELNASFGRHISVIRDVVEEYKKLNTEFTKIPSEYIKRLERVSVLNERLEKSERQLTQAKKESEQARKREVEDYQRRARAFDRAEKQAKRLEAQQRKEAERLKQVNNAYNQAQNALKRLSEEYNHLAMRKQMGERLTKQELSDLKRLRKEVLSYQNALKSVDAQRGVFNRNVGNYASGFGGGIRGMGSQLMGALGIVGGVYGAVNVGKQIYETTKQLDVINKSMNATATNARDLALNMEFLNRITEDSGLRFTDTAIAYNKFYAASKDKLSLTEIQTIFDKISKSAALMGMSVNDQNLIFLALEQMMSKGKVSAEELRRQLGERLPGAFDIMAKAVGVSTTQLDDMMRKGEVISSEVLPKFAVEVEKAFSGDKIERVENMAAAENRLSNAWTHLVDSMNSGEGTLAKVSMGFMDMATSVLKSVTVSKQLSEEIQKEQVELNMLVGRIVDLNENNKERESLIIQLKNTYPDFISFIKDEDFSNKNLLETLNLVNDNYRDRILLQTQVEKTSEAIRKRDSLVQKQSESLLHSYRQLININTKYDLGLTITPSNIQEVISEMTKLRGSVSGLEKDLLKVRQPFTRSMKQFEKDIEIANDEVQAQKAFQEELYKSLGIITESEKESLSQMEDYNKRLEERIKLAKELGGVVGKDFFEFDLDSVNSFINSKQGGKPKDPKKSGKDPVLERIKAEYELQRAILQTASLEAQIAGNSEEYYTKEQELALLERNYKLAIAEREVKDKGVLAQRKLTIEEEYNQKIIKLNDTEGKEFEKNEDEKAKAHQKYLQKRLKMMQGVYEDMLKVVNDAYDKEMAILRLQEQGFDYQGLEYWENRRRQLDLMLENRKISLEEYNLEIENLGKEQKQIFKDYLGSFTDLGQFGFGSLNKFFNGAFEEIWAGAETLEEKFTASFLAMSEVAKDLYNVISQGSQAYFENEYANLELQKEVAIKYAGESAETRERIEEQYQARKSELKRQEAQQEKQAAIFNAIINIATGVTAALSQAPPYSFILAALVGALGAVQISTIASTPLPQFWRGTDNAPEGWAIVDEKRPEVHTDKKGNIKSFGYSGGANLRFLEQGDKIYPSHEAFFNEMGMSAPINGVIEGYSAIDYERMEAIMDKTVGKITLQQNVIDEGGFKRYIVKGNSRTELKNKRILKS